MSDTEPDDEGPAVGIDLGTTFSCAAVFVNGKPKVLANAHGNRITPSCVAFTDNGHLVGEEARYKLSINPTRTVYQVKRLMGHTFDDPEVQADISHYSFDVVNDDGKPMIKVLSDAKLKLYSPEEISAMILVKMKELAEEYTGKTVEKAVITVPAYFNDSQRQATKTAAKVAGLEVLRLISEPTAAAIAYGFKKTKDEKRLLMFDLGGGTFDVSVLQVDEGIMQVLATGGNTHLGGADFDNRMVDKLINHFNQKTQLDEQVTTNIRKTLRHRLARAVEFAKCQISADNKSTINIDDFHEGMDFVYEMYQDEFNETNQDLFHETIKHVQSVLEDANLAIDEIDEVVLVGGSTRIPLVQRLLKEFFNGKKLNKSINPDEAVACGAAIEAAILNGVKDVDDILLMDVTPLSLGVEIKGGLMMNILDRNTLIPATGKREGTTVRDNQERVDLVVFQGERTLARDNHFLGEFVLDNIESAPAGVPKIDVKFDLDSDGILKVTAKDKATGAKKSIRIDRNKTRMSEADIQQAIQDAQAHRTEDQKERCRIVACNQLEMFVQWVRYLINNQLMKLHISNDYRDDILEKCAEIDIWVKENEQASKDEYEWQYDIIKDVCKDLPPDYLTPGQLPGGVRVKNYMKPTALHQTLNDDAATYSDDEEVGELD